jgi:ribosomal protein S18 acetylase RimI-like enzyme
VLGQFPPGKCRTPVRQQLRFAFALHSVNVGELWRLWNWLSASEARDLAEPHWHLGPVAVDPGRRGEGIGSQMLRAFCARMDELGEVAFLETDKLDGVRFYARCGFEGEGTRAGTRHAELVDAPPGAEARRWLSQSGSAVERSPSGSLLAGTGTPGLM